MESRISVLESHPVQAGSLSYRPAADPRSNKRLGEVSPMSAFRKPVVFEKRKASVMSQFNRNYYKGSSGVHSRNLYGGSTLDNTTAV